MTASEKKKLYGIQHKALEIIAGSEATTLIESLEVNWKKKYSVSRDKRG